MEECGPCPVFASFTLAFALQLRKKHGKTSIRVRKTSVRLRKISVRLRKTSVTYYENTHILHNPQKYTHYKTRARIHTHTHITKQYKALYIYIYVYIYIYIYIYSALLKSKLNMYSVWHNYVIFYYYYSTIGYEFRPQKAINRPIFTKQLKNAGAYSTKMSILWDHFYNYYQPLDVLSVVSCGEILYCEYCGCISKIFLDWQP